jgi:murein DD-endopeptidase MepM/ murein hydrolase activator NlpD
VTSGYGYRISPFTGRRSFHAGLDIASKFGTPIVAPARGRVVFVGRKGPLGKSLVIDHGFGLRTSYGHVADFDVERGQKIERGQRIASVGSTGRSTGPHLHYTVEVKGKSVNPHNYIFE